MLHLFISLLTGNSPRFSISALRNGPQGPSSVTFRSTSATTASKKASNLSYSENAETSCGVGWFRAATYPL